MSTISSETPDRFPNVFFVEENSKRRRGNFGTRGV
jgi:hypothetical protein